MTQQAMEIRVLAPDDASEWIRLRIEALEAEPAAFSASLDQYRALSLEEVKNRLWSRPDAIVVGAFDGAKMSGMAGFYREQGAKSCHKGRIWGVYVTSSERGRGLGRQMMVALLERAAAIPGVEQVLLSVTSSQTAALSLYRSMGFQIFGTEPRALNIAGLLVDEHYLILRLGKQDDSELQEKEKAP